MSIWTTVSVKASVLLKPWLTYCMLLVKQKHFAEIQPALQQHVLSAVCSVYRAALLLSLFFFFADKMNLVIMCSHRLIIKKDSLVISVSVSSLDCSAPVGNKRNFHTTWHSSSQTSENLWQCMSHKYTHFMRINFHFSWLGGLPGLSFSHTRFFFSSPPFHSCFFSLPNSRTALGHQQLLVWRCRGGGGGRRAL